MVIKLLQHIAEMSTAAKLLSPFFSWPYYRSRLCYSVASVCRCLSV